MKQRLTFLQVEGYELIKPIDLIVEKDKSYWLAYDTLGFIYGTGLTISEAMTDYQRDLVYEFQSLERDSSILGVNLLNQLLLMRQYLKPVVQEERDELTDYSPLDGATVTILAEDWEDVVKAFAEQRE